jgi:cell wall-associated NlpC family hydrolase
MGKLIAAAVTALVVPVLLLSAAAAGVVGTDGTDGSAVAPGQPGAGPHAVADIPADMLTLYQRAATADCDGLPWTVLAAIGKVESDHGRSPLPGVHSGSNSAGAQGPMQFLPATFAAYNRPVPPGGANPPSPYDPVDAVHAAARYLCTSGARAGRDIPGAIWHYNHSDAYVRQVLTIARSYAAAAAPADAADAAAKAVAFARQQLGVPYVWGGDGPTEGGFDCSGLTRAAYATAGITIPRTADLQWRAGPAIPTGQELQPGDLLFYGTPAKATHVTLYVGDSRVVHAPQPGETVQYATVWTTGFLGATRPTARG